MSRRHDPLEDLGAELRDRLGSRFRRAAEEDEQAALHLRRRGRTLEHVAHELLARGDTVQVNVGTERFVGEITYARGDLATLVTANDDEVHINLLGPVVMRVTRRARFGGRSANLLGPESFVARLRQAEIDATVVVVAMPTIGESIACRIAAVSVDHVMLTDLTEQSWFVPFDQIATVTKRG